MRSKAHQHYSDAQAGSDDGRREAVASIKIERLLKFSLSEILSDWDEKNLNLREKIV